MNIHEQLLLVDDNDTFSGTYANRLTCHTGKGLHHRAFVVVVYNEKNEILLQKRKHVLWDGYWDVTAISHVLHKKEHDETYEEAAHRALKVEMGIPPITLRKIAGFNYYAIDTAYCENEYCAILLGKWFGTIKANKEVIYDYMWMPIKEFYMDIEKKPKKYAPWTIFTAQALSTMHEKLFSS